MSATINLSNVGSMYDNGAVKGNFWGWLLTVLYGTFLVWRWYISSYRKIRGKFTSDDPYPNEQAMLQSVYSTGKLNVWNGANNHPGMPGIINLCFRLEHDWFGHLNDGMATTATVGKFTAQDEIETSLTNQLRHTPKLFHPVVIWEIAGQLLSVEGKAGSFPPQKTLTLP